MGNRLHVMLVSEPGLDGVFRHVEGLTAHLLSQGHIVDLAHSTLRSSPEALDLVRKIEASGGRTIDLRVGNSPGYRDVPAFLKLRALVLERKPDLIHAHSSKAGGLVRLLPNPGRIPMFYTPHAYFGLQAGKHWRGRFYNRVERVLGGRGYTINVSASEQGFAQVVLRIPPALRMTIPNGVDLTRYRPATPAERAEARRSLGLPLEGKILGCVARLSPQKDPHTLYQAFAEARRLGVQAHLAHVGTGPNPTYAQELLQGPLREHVSRIPILSDTVRAYHAFDGLISTSRYEGLSLVLLEALGCGLPLVVSNVGGNDDVIRVKPNAVEVFTAGDIFGAAGCIQAWAGKCARAETNNHRELALQHFDSQVCYRRIESAYFQSLSRPTALLLEDLPKVPSRSEPTLSTK